MQAEFEVGNQKVQVDFSEMEQRMLSTLTSENKKLMEQWFKELRTAQKPKGGKGVVEAWSDEETARKQRVVEEFQRGERLNPAAIKEQWTIAVPRYSKYEVSPHLRDFVWVTDVVKGKPGETVNIPVVYDIDFQHVVVKTGTFTAKTDLVNVFTTTLHEAGAYYDAYYGDIEKIDANLLEELNRVFAHAAVRAEDWDLIAFLNTYCTTGSCNSKGGATQTDPYRSGTTSDTMDAELIIDGITNLMKRGKDVHPGELLLILDPNCYNALMQDIIGSTPMSAARPDVVQKGMLEEFLGIKIVVAGRSTNNHSFGIGGGTSYNVAYLLRPKRALALAPKRDILIETDKLIATRQLRIAASHTFGVCMLDATEVMVLVCGNSKHVSGD